MYYNISTGEIEDYVGGMEDLKNMNLRTPGEARGIFNDDPLRMLRVLRFHSKYPNSTIDPEILEVLKEANDPNSEFSKNYMEKVNPSRAAKELRKTMQGENALSSARKLLESGLYKRVFRIPEDWRKMNIDQQSPHHNVSLLEHTINVMKGMQGLAKHRPTEERGLLLLSSMLHDFGKMSPSGHKYKYNAKTGEPVMFDRDGEQIHQIIYTSGTIDHARESGKFANDIMALMGFAEDERRYVVEIVKDHMLPHKIDTAISKYEEVKRELEPVVRENQNRLNEANIEEETRKIQQELKELVEQISLSESHESLRKKFNKKREELKNVNTKMISLRSAQKKLDKERQRMNKTLGKYLRRSDKILDEQSNSLADMKKKLSPKEYDKYKGDKEEWVERYENLWYDKMMHGTADADKGGISTDDLQRLHSQRQYTTEKVREYRNQMAALTRKAILDGNMIRNVVTELTPELASSNGRLFSKKLGIRTPVHYIKFIQEALIDQQQRGALSTPEEAEQFLRKNIKQWFGNWNAQKEGQKNKKANIKNMSNVNKKAEGNFLDRYQEGRNNIVNYFAISPFQKGDKVKLRTNVGCNATMHPLVVGRVVDVTPYEVIVKWEEGTYDGKDVSGKTQKFALENPMALYLMLEKVD